MSIVQVAAIGVICAVLAITLRSRSPEFAMLISLSASLLIFFMVMPVLAGAIGVVQNLGGYIDSRVPYAPIVLQMLGIAYIAELGAQVCHDAGESAIASRIELAGKVLIMALAAPILLDVLRLISGIMP